MSDKAFHILISRTDAIGDVVLTLPMCGILKANIPNVRVSFLGRTYTGPVIKSCTAVNEFINFDDIEKLDAAGQIALLRNKKIDAVVNVFPNAKVGKLAKAAGIKLRIGTTNRLHHWFTCNKLVRLSRKNSPLHEAQLNIGLLKPFNIDVPAIDQIPRYYNFKPHTNLPPQFSELLIADKFNLVLHPKSHGSGVEWPLERYEELINLLPEDRFKIFVSGSPNEKLKLAEWIKTLSGRVTDLTGQMTLDELIAFIAQADGLVASGTGPLHIAAASGIHTLGLFPNTRPIHPQRWAPLGIKAEYIESDSGTLNSIKAELVAQTITQWKK